MLKTRDKPKQPEYTGLSRFFSSMLCHGLSLITTC